MAKILGLQLQHQSFQRIFKVDFLLGLTGLISLLSNGLSRVFSSTTVLKHQFSVLSLFYSPALISICDYWKDLALTIQTFVDKVMSLFINTLSRFVIAFLPRSNRLLISCYVPTISYRHVGRCSYRCEENYKPL